MKKFTKIIMCLMLCVLSVCLVACGSANDKDFNYPTSSGEVYGNSGLAVRRGNYLYFVNGYQTVDSLTEQNASYVLGSLMVAELDGNGNVATDDNGIMKNVHTMSDRLCGFEATNLFIGGDYLYFTSPCQEDESEGSSKDPVWAKDRVVFYKIALNSSTKPEEIYQSTVSYEDLTFKYYNNGGNTFILIYEDGTSKDGDTTDALIRVDTSSKDSNVISENVLSYSMSDNGEQIFFSVENNDLYQLKQYNIYSNSATNFTSKSKSFDIVDVKGGKVFISYATDYDINKSTTLYVAGISPKSAFETGVTSVQAYDKYYISEDGNFLIGLKNNTIKVVRMGETSNLNKVTDSDAESLTYLGLANGCLIYKDNNNIIKSFSYYNYVVSNESEIKQLAKVEDMDTTYIDIDEDYIYFYKTVNSNSYLHRVSTKATYVEDETNYQMIGRYLDGDVPEVEEIEE